MTGRHASCPTTGLHPPSTTQPPAVAQRPQAEGAGLAPKDDHCKVQSHFNGPTPRRSPAAARCGCRAGPKGRPLQGAVALQGPTPRRSPAAARCGCRAGPAVWSLRFIHSLYGLCSLSGIRSTHPLHGVRFLAGPRESNPRPVAFVQAGPATPMDARIDESKLPRFWRNSNPQAGPHRPRHGGAGKTAQNETKRIESPALPPQQKPCWPGRPAALTAEARPPYNRRGFASPRVARVPRPAVAVDVWV